MQKKFLYIIFLSSLFCQTATAVELAIKNDLNVREDGIKMRIEDAVSIEAPRNRVSFKVEPGETKTITGGNVRSFFLVRQFTRNKLKYDIICPKTKSEGKRLLVTVAKAHKNKLPGGCKVVRIGHWSKLSGTNWDVIDKDASVDLQDERRGNSSLRRN